MSFADGLYHEQVEQQERDFKRVTHWAPGMACGGVAVDVFENDRVELKLEGDRMITLYADGRWRIDV